MRKLRAAFVCLLLCGVLAPLSAAQAQDDTSRFYLRSRALKRLAADRAAAPGGFLPSSLECRVQGAPSNLNLDCDDPVFGLPNNEPHIAVDPANPGHMIASSNDYESCCDQFYTTFDGGRTWRTGDMSAEDPARIGSDPVTAIDPVSGNAIHSSLNYLCNAQGVCRDGDVVVSISKDGGLHWGNPVEVYDGRGDDNAPVQIFNDKQWIATDSDPDSPFYGRTYLTWSRFRSHSGNYAESPIWESHSDDGGLTWSRAQEISGSNAICTYQETGAPRECDEDQGSVIAIAPDGTVYVAFENGQHEAAWEGGEQFESTYMVVRSTDGGATWSPPAYVADLEDGSRDFPINVDGRQTLTNYQLRVPTYGNITADPNTGKLYITFMDNRNGRHDVANPVTDTDVFITSSMNGVNWTRPTPVSPRDTDQWFPWADVNPRTGDVAVVYHDRTRDGPYHTSMAVGTPGDWTYTRLSSDGSHPRNSLYFRAGVEGCRKCSVFHGDYISLEFGSDGKANAVWTDMRNFIDLSPPPSARGYTENIFFSRR